MVIVVFRSRFRSDADIDAYEALSARMHALVEGHPGFISIENFEEPDGTSVSLELFETADSAASWRRHPEHLEAQRRGREEFYSWYQVHTSTVTRSHEFHFDASGASE
jgi:heme-degrading monooxygenase HmoA